MSIHPNYQRLGYQEWEETYKPIDNHLDPDKKGTGKPYQCMFETYGAELDFVLQVNEVENGRVWTLVQVDLDELGVEDERDENDIAYDNTAIIAGYHIVNRLGYYITEVGVEAANVHIEAYDEDTLAVIENAEKKAFRPLSEAEQTALETYFADYHDEFTASRRQRCPDGPKGLTSIDRVDEVCPGLTINVSIPSPTKPGDQRYLFWWIIKD